MPYITAERKEHLHNYKSAILNAGDLTYLLYAECMRSTNSRPRPDMLRAFDELVKRYLPKQVRYENLVVVLGSLDATARELKRRHAQTTIDARSAIRIYTEDFYHEIVAPYEDQKIKQNGDVP